MIKSVIISGVKFTYSEAVETVYDAVGVYKDEKITIPNALLKIYVKHKVQPYISIIDNLVQTIKHTVDMAKVIGGER